MNGKLKCPRVRGIPKKVWAQCIRIEMEHTKDRKAARCIAAVHLQESGAKYCSELLKMEKRLKRGG